MKPQSKKEAGLNRKQRDANVEAGEDEVTRGTRSLVIVPIISSRALARGKGAPERPFGAERSPQARLEEAVGLAAAIELEIVSSGLVRLANVKPGSLFGSGKVEEIRGQIEIEEIELVVVDHPLTPIQQRNLERDWNTKVIDRTGLILEIFGERAQTKEGRLQVELAHLTWQKSRLVRSWTHLERQRGGLGFVGGPGETQIEADRRIIQDRITLLKGQLEQVQRTRKLHRKQRKKVPHPVIAFVGYTNAGKSTLFNRMTNAEVFAKDLLFATLDPTLRRLKLPHGREVILSDTVGFISELPHNLVAAFRATLEEVIQADIVLHVRDIAHEDTKAQSLDVNETLEMLGLKVSESDRVIEVYNKIDKLDEAHREKLLESNSVDEGPISVSAISGDGIPDLLARIEARLAEQLDTVTMVLPHSDGQGHAWLYQHCEILSRDDVEDGIRLAVRVPDAHRSRVRERFAKYFVTGLELPDEPVSEEDDDTDDSGYSPI
ncbi:GTP-binding protein HSR1 [Pseudovibrio sp. FO-BEG1]|uniref:GTPase HflX n=1 Tax=Pseudovibrio sp. (strain FO-BEG1) TaxID=911045 RepID=UPI000238C434|nr:GTPase HflX [Pseudovibrio sp. FO-BEG1]AEV37778.1 GTP-binding protein HSR1 [Pseudovibrio sp. FO-BEG1]